ncbi:MAG: lipocalin family protein [Nitrososphaeria archaeon]|nr:lipocalin family protein [Nitrososphaeria archaeon]
MYMSDKLKIKRVLIIALIVLVIVVVIGLLLKRPPIIGKWTVESTSIGSLQLPISLISGEWTFNPDGTFSISYDSISRNGKWSLEDDKLTLYLGDVSISFTIKFSDNNNKMVWVYEANVLGTKVSATLNFHRIT